LQTTGCQPERLFLNHWALRAFFLPLALRFFLLATFLALASAALASPGLAVGAAGAAALPGAAGAAGVAGPGDWAKALRAANPSVAEKARERMEDIGSPGCLKDWILEQTKLPSRPVIAMVQTTPMSCPRL